MKFIEKIKPWEIVDESHFIQGSIPPAYLGRSYLRYTTNQIVFVLIPFNFPAKWIRDIYWRFWRFFKKGPDAEMRYIERIKRERYKAGFMDGMAEGKEEGGIIDIFRNAHRMARNADK